MIGTIKRIDSALASQLRQGRGETPELYQCKADDEKQGTCQTLDKTWAGIDFLVQNGESDAVSSGTFLGAKKPVYLEKDFGYGPALLISMQEVKHISDDLEKISDEEFLARCTSLQPALIEKEIYPFSASETPKEIYDYTFWYFIKLKLIFADAAKRGDSVLFWLM